MRDRQNTPKVRVFAILGIMAVKIIVLDDHTGEELPGATPDDYLTVRVGELTWRVYLGEESADHLEDTVRRFFNGMEPSSDGGDREVRRTTKAGNPPGKKADRWEPEERIAQRNKIREWAANHERPFLRDQKIIDKGRIPKKVVQAFYEEFPDEPHIFAID